MCRRRYVGEWDTRIGRRESQVQGSPRPQGSPRRRAPSPGGTCTAEVWGAMATSKDLDGSHTCGDRIKWLVETKHKSMADACQKVAEEFPSVCGSCTPCPSSCSAEVWATVATLKGESATCGNRIDWVVKNQNKSV